MVFGLLVGASPRLSLTGTKTDFLGGVLFKGRIILAGIALREPLKLVGFYLVL